MSTMRVLLILVVLACLVPRMDAAEGGTTPVAAPAQATGAAPAKPFISDTEWGKAAPGPASGPAGSGVAGQAAVSMMLSLAAVVAVALLLALAVKKLKVRRLLPGRGRHLQVIETVPLGFKRAVSLVRIGDQVLVLGQGEHEVSHLATLPASVLDEAPRPGPVPGIAVAPTPAAPRPLTPPPAGPSAFQATLERAVERRP
jgi:flagellar biosynthetic protein FliO